MWSLCAKLTDSLPTSRSEGWSDEDDDDDDDDALLNDLLSDDGYDDDFGDGDDDDYDGDVKRSMSLTVLPPVAHS